MTLRLIYSRGSTPPPPPTGGGGGGAGTGGGRRRRRRRHFLAPLLWYATCRAFFAERATTVNEVAERMTRLSRQILGRYYDVSAQQAERVLAVVRDTPLAYGFGYPHVQKGSGEDRAYVPIQTDYDPALGRAFLVDDDDLDSIKQGAVSSLTTLATMMQHEAVNLEMAEGVWPGEFNGIVDDLRRMATQMKRLAARAKML